MEKKFFAIKGVTWFFGIIAIIAGFIFLDSSVTGNAIANNPSSVNLLSLIGLVLVVCSAVLISYSVRKR